MRRSFMIAAALAAFAATAAPASAHDRFTGTVVGAGAGALSGGLIGGPVGALVGGVAGVFVGGHVGARWHDRYTYGRGRDNCWRDRYGRTVCERDRW